MDLGNYLKSINFEKNHLMDNLEIAVEAEKDYKPFIVNRCLSGFPDTLLHAQEMNLNGFLDSKMQYDYLFYSIRKRKRFSPWLKPDIPEHLDIVKEYYGYGNAKAKEALRILTEDDLEVMKSRLNKGGFKK